MARNWFAILHAFIAVGDSIDVMHKGTLIIKLRSSSKKYPRKYFLDQETVNIRWTPSKKGDRAKSKGKFCVHIYLTAKLNCNCSQNIYSGYRYFLLCGYNNVTEKK